MVLLFLVISAIFFVSLRKTAQRATDSAEYVAELNQEISRLEEEVAELERRLETAQSDFTREKILRDELLLQKPGEQVVKLPPLPPQPPPPEPEPEPEPWQAWRVLLGV
ncbi:MAG: hypothetical protein COU69_03560 [Candidatus Pacebacteria bacterium CG10_big_fil_rev_8_21_14_0_10_56_10]|nr:MAG: hypothetical protein COU69_03560 [Candidatus Pacebacteria bacterium CG10_big_fil_rev_8_21_14_0_10_56_10]